MDVCVTVMSLEYQHHRTELHVQTSMSVALIMVDVSRLVQTMSAPSLVAVPRDISSLITASPVKVSLGGSIHDSKLVGRNLIYYVEMHVGVLFAQ